MTFDIMSHALINQLSSQHDSVKSPIKQASPHYRLSPNQALWQMMLREVFQVVAFSLDHLFS